MLTRVSKVLTLGLNTEVKVCGWVRTMRSQKNYSFIELDDGSGKIQIVIPSNKVGTLVTGASIEVSGLIAQGPKSLEIQCETLSTIGASDMVIPKKTYPLAKKSHTMEHLRENIQFRPRTETIAAGLRLRSEASFAIHDFFRSQGKSHSGFYYIHTPIITGNDCEGAGEMFEIKDSEDFFSKKAYLTVSGQLHAEIFASSLGRVYTFGPTFRAEKSHTQRHLAEFWMIEPEMMNFSLESTHNLAEHLIKHTISHILKHNQYDLNILNRKPEEFDSILNNNWQRLTYTQAKSLTNKNDPGLSTEEERWLTDSHFKAPVIVTNYPSGMTPFYMKKNEEFAENFDLLMPGVGEVVGGSVREEQFDVLSKKIPDAGSLAWYLDLRKYGTVKHSGFGLGFERLLLFISGLSNVRDIVPVPRTPKNLLC